MEQVLFRLLTEEERKEYNRVTSSQEAVELQFKLATDKATNEELGQLAEFRAIEDEIYKTVLDRFLALFKDDPAESILTAARQEMEQYTKEEYENIFCAAPDQGEETIRLTGQAAALYFAGSDEEKADVEEYLKLLQSKDRRGFEEWLHLTFTADRLFIQAAAYYEVPDEVITGIKDLYRSWAASQYPDEGEQLSIDIITPAELTEQKIEAARSLIKTIRPKEFLYSSTKVSQTLPKIYETNNYEIDVTSQALKKKGKQAIVHLGVNLDGIKKLGLKNIDYYDLVVMSSMATLGAVGNKIMTPQMIYEVYGGKGKASEKTIKEIDQSITKSMVTLANINNYEEAALYGYKEFEKVTHNLIYAKKIEKVKLNGQTVETAYMLLEIPFLIQYAETNNQIRRLPAGLINGPLRMDKDNVTLHYFLIAQIQAMQGSRSNYIKYETIYELLGAGTPENGVIDKPTKEKRHRIRQHVLTELEFFKTGIKPGEKVKTAEPLIKDFQEEKKGKQFVSVKINF